MRITWLTDDVVKAARKALSDHRPDWRAHFAPEFRPPPCPEQIESAEWPMIAEHIARAERVSFFLRDLGFDRSLEKFANSPHAIEVATLLVAAEMVDRMSLDLVVALLQCEVDELVLYGTFLTILVKEGARQDPQRMMEIYEQFCGAVLKVQSTHPLWPDRVASVRDGLACVFAIHGRPDDAHQIFLQRHRQEPGNLTVSLAASRAFLSAGFVGRAAQWLGIGADRAKDLGRDETEAKLRKKQLAIRERMS